MIEWKSLRRGSDESCHLVALIAATIDIGDELRARIALPKVVERCLQSSIVDELDARSRKLKSLTACGLVDRARETECLIAVDHWRMRHHPELQRLWSGGNTVVAIMAFIEAGLQRVSVFDNHINCS